MLIHRGSVASARALKKHLQATAPYDVGMSWFSREFMQLSRNFFTNWADSDLPVGKKLTLTARNRAKALRHGCCGNHGQPGC